MQEDMNVRRPKRTHEILASNSLSPVTTSTAREPIGKPQRDVVVPGRTTWAGAVIIILVEEAAARRVALGDPAAVAVRVDVDAGRRALKEVLVADGPADDLDGDARVGELVEADQPLHPLVVLGLQDRGDLVALGFCHRGAGLPADAVVDLSGKKEAGISGTLGSQRVVSSPFVGDQLVVSVVLESKRVAICRHLMVPHLLEGCDEVGWRVPRGLTLGKTLLHLGTDMEVIDIVPDCTIGVRKAAVVGTGEASSQGCGRHESGEPHLGGLRRRMRYSQSEDLSRYRELTESYRIAELPHL